MLSHTGQGTTEMTVVPSLAVDGTTCDCRRRPCQVTVLDPMGTIAGAADIPGAVPYADVALDRSTGLAEVDIIQARIESAIPASSPTITSRSASPRWSRTCCRRRKAATSTFPVAGPGTHTYDLIVYEDFTPYGGGSEVSCRDDPGGCIIGVGTDVTAAGYAPISFADPPGALVPG